VGAVWILRGGNTFEGSRAMQAVCGSEAGSPGLVRFGGRIFSVIPARTAVNSACDNASLAFPDESLCRDLPVAFGAFGQVQGLQVGFQALFPFAGGSQVSQGGAQVSLGGWLCGCLEQESRHRVVYRHKHSEPEARHFKIGPRGSSKRVQHPIAWSEMFRQEC
jgi:hypothetical protein